MLAPKTPYGRLCLPRYLGGSVSPRLRRQPSSIPGHTIALPPHSPRKDQPGQTSPRPLASRLERATRRRRPDSLTHRPGRVHPAHLPSMPFRGAGCEIGLAWKRSPHQPRKTKGNAFEPFFRLDPKPSFTSTVSLSGTFPGVPRKSRGELSLRERRWAV